MTASYHIFSDEGLCAEEKVARLHQLNDDLSKSLQTLSSFQRKILAIPKRGSIEEVLDQMEILLDDAVDYVYMRLYLEDPHEGIGLVREMCPSEMDVDWAMIEWARNNQELAIIPVEQSSADESNLSMLLLPLTGPDGPEGILVLWIDMDPSEFTQELSTSLQMLARETGAAIEAQHARERIRETQAVMSDVVESVPHGLLAIDQDGVINVISSTMEIMLNVRREDVQTKSYRKVMPDAVANLLTRTLETGGQEEQELTMPVRGIEESFGISVYPMYRDSGTGPTGHVVLCRDLKLSREVAKLRELDAMKNDFLSLVSHELRTPLTSIMAYSETLLMEGMVETEEERKEYLQIIHDEGSRLSRLINDVLDLTKMEAGKMEYLYEDQSIIDVLKTAMASSSSLSAQKEISVIPEFEEGLPSARIDADRIMQVLMNLLSNAIKFTPEKGTITLRAKKSKPFPDRPGPTITVEVEDTGIGISPENLNRVFSKFEQIENIEHHTVGTGLGMPICRQIVEEGHGGRIWIESELNVGTTIFFRIPTS